MPAVSDAAPTPAATPTADSGAESAVAPGTSSTDAATTPPSVPATTPEHPPTGDQPPAQKWAQVLDNARSKERTRVLEEYGIVDGYDPTEVRAHLSLVSADPLRYYNVLGQWLERQGMLKPPEPATPPAAAEPVRLPEPLLRSTDGQEAYTAQQVLDVLQLFGENLRREWSGALQPLHDLQHHAAVEKMRTEARAFAGEAIREAKTWHKFDELTPRVKEIMEADKRTTLQSAYNRALQEHLKTATHQLKQETRRETLAEIQQASASNTVRPGVTASAASTARPPKGGMDARIDRAISSALHSSH